MAQTRIPTATSSGSWTMSMRRTRSAPSSNARLASAVPPERFTSRQQQPPSSLALQEAELKKQQEARVLRVEAAVAALHSDEADLKLHEPAISKLLSQTVLDAALSQLLSELLLGAALGKHAQSSASRSVVWQKSMTLRAEAKRQALDAVDRARQMAGDRDLVAGDRDLDAVDRVRLKKQANQKPPTTVGRRQAAPAVLRRNSSSAGAPRDAEALVLAVEKAMAQLNTTPYATLRQDAEITALLSQLLLDAALANLLADRIVKASLSRDPHAEQKAGALRAKAQTLARGSIHRALSNKAVGQQKPHWQLLHHLTLDQYDLHQYDLHTLQHTHDEQHDGHEPTQRPDSVLARPDEQHRVGLLTRSLKLSVLATRGMRS